MRHAVESLAALVRLTPFLDGLEPLALVPCELQVDLAGGHDAHLREFDDTDRLVEFYTGVFDATLFATREEAPGMKLTFVDIGPATQLTPQ